MTTDQQSNEPIEFPSDQDASGRTLGAEELRAPAARALESGTLTSTKGTSPKELERRFADHIVRVDPRLRLHLRHGRDPHGHRRHRSRAGRRDRHHADHRHGGAHADPLSGSDPRLRRRRSGTCNVTAEDDRGRLSERTRAIIVTHLFGNPCEMDEIMELAGPRDIPVIEDCAQAYLARASTAGWSARSATIGCFSLQQGKHITTGEGGLVVTDDADLARRMFLFINKAWGYGDAKPDHYFLALNYR